MLIAVICAVPLILNLMGVAKDPRKELVHDSGYAALNLLVLTLAARPLTRLGWTFLMRGRRWLGVSCFLYACVHLAAHLAGIGLNPAAMLAETRKNLYILPGLAAFLLMAPLALTSTNAMVRRLGGSWGRLHALVYPAAAAAAVHYAWGIGEVRANVLIYSTVLAALLAGRAVTALRR